MNKKNMMRDFINKIYSRGLMTDFLKNIFDYEEMNDYNYFFRMIDNENELIIDIYDNVSSQRFNRYIFSFEDVVWAFRIVKENDIFVHYICVLKATNEKNKLIKLAHLFQIADCMMLEYASSFLNPEFVEILAKIPK